MSSIQEWPKPHWLAAKPESPEATSYYLRLAVAFCEDGNNTCLAKLLGVTPNTIALAKHRGTCSHDLAIRIEKLYGRKLFPRELFRTEPELPSE